MIFNPSGIKGARSMRMILLSKCRMCSLYPGISIIISFSEPEGPLNWVLFPDTLMHFHDFLFLRALPGPQKYPYP